MDKADIEGFVERGIAKVKAELGSEPFRAVPHWPDLIAAVRGVLQHLSDEAKGAASAIEHRVQEPPFAPVSPKPAANAAEPDPATE